MAAGEMNRDEFVAFLKCVFANMAAVSQDGAIHFQFMDWAHTHEMLVAGHHVYAQLKNICVWAKSNAGMGSFYRSHPMYLGCCAYSAGRCCSAAWYHSPSSPPSLR